MENNDEIERAAGLVEAMIRKQGIDPASVRMAPPGQGARVVAHARERRRGRLPPPAHEGGDSPKLRVVSPIVKIDDTTRPELYKTLLELNATGLGGMASASTRSAWCSSPSAAPLTSSPPRSSTSSSASASSPTTTTTRSSRATAAPRSPSSRPHPPPPSPPRPRYARSVPDAPGISPGPRRWCNRPLAWNAPYTAGVVVVGMGASGEAAAVPALRKGAASVVLNDRRDAADLKEARLALANHGVRLNSAATGGDLRAKADLVVMSPGVPPLEAVQQAEGRGVPCRRRGRVRELVHPRADRRHHGDQREEHRHHAGRRDARAEGFWRPSSAATSATRSRTRSTPPAADEGGPPVVEVSPTSLEKTRTSARRSPSTSTSRPTTSTATNPRGGLARRIRADLPPPKADDHAVVPGDDPLLVATARAYSARCTPFGGEKSEGPPPRRVDRHGLGRVYPLSFLNIRGTHNVSNAMASVLAAEFRGRARGHHALARQLTGLPHRMQFVLTDEGVVFYDDSKATNVGAAVKALEGVDRRVVLIAGGRDKGGSYDPLVQLLRVKGRAVVLLGEAAPVIKAALGNAIAHREAGTCSTPSASRGSGRARDCVLWRRRAASLDMFESYAERGRSFAAAVRARWRWRQ